MSKNGYHDESISLGYFCHLWGSFLSRCRSLFGSFGSILHPKKTLPESTANFPAILLEPRETRLRRRAPGGGGRGVQGAAVVSEARTLSVALGRSHTLSVALGRSRTLSYGLAPWSTDRIRLIFGIPESSHTPDHRVPRGRRIKASWKRVF